MRCAKVLIAAGMAVVLAACSAPPERKTPSRSPTPSRSTKPPVTPGRTAQRPKPAAPAPKTAPGQTPPKAARADVQLSADERFAGALELMQSNNWGDAEKAFTVLTQAHPQYSGPWTNLGIIYAKTNRKDKARGAFTKASAANPSNAVAFTWLGILHREAGDYARAEIAYRRALSSKPNYGYAHLNLGILYDQHLRRPQEALRHYRRYKEIAGDKDLRAAVWVAELESRAAAGTRPVQEAKP